MVATIVLITVLASTHYDRTIVLILKLYNLSANSDH